MPMQALLLIHQNPFPTDRHGSAAISGRIINGGISTAADDD
jgi:hypothetical protein